MGEKFQTLHPDPNKQGVRIDKNRYDLIRETILQIMSEQQPLPFTELVTNAESTLAGHFMGSVPWYVVTIKLDLEARGVIERVPKTKPERLRLVKT